MKKSTQERLALKILIDRPKARNEVRGNAVMVVINTCCLLSGAVSVCFVLPACYQSLLIPVFVFFFFLASLVLQPVCMSAFVWNTAVNSLS